MENNNVNDKPVDSELKKLNEPITETTTQPLNDELLKLSKNQLKKIKKKEKWLKSKPEKR